MSGPWCGTPSAGICAECERENLAVGLLPDETPPAVLAAPEIAAVLNRLRELWAGADESAAIRSAVGDFCKALDLRDVAASEFWRACGYELLNSYEWKGEEHGLRPGGGA